MGNGHVLRLPHLTPYGNWGVIGRQWVGSFDGRYLNWRTGEQRTGAPYPALNLDDPQLGPVPTACAPFAALQASPLAMFGNHVLLPRGPSGPVRIGTCGSSRAPLNLSHGRAFDDESLEYGRTAWVHLNGATKPCDPKVHLYSVSKGDMAVPAPHWPGKRCGFPQMHTRFGQVMASHWTDRRTEDGKLYYPVYRYALIRTR